MRGLVLIWFVIYLAGGIYGCMHITEGLEPASSDVHYLSLAFHYFFYFDNGCLDPDAKSCLLFSVNQLHNIR